MDGLSYSSAVLLGLVQAATEFLPVSSSAHLALTQTALGLKPDSPEMLLFDVCSHLGTLCSIFVVFRHAAGRFIARLIREAKSRSARRGFGWPIMFKAIIATLPTGIIGLSLKEHFEALFASPFWIGVGLLITGALLLATRLLTVILPKQAGRGGLKRGWRDWGYGRAFMVGVAQGIAIYPGISRSGTTICVALYTGLHRVWAVHFSFLIAVPTMLGAALIKFKDAAELHTAVAWGPILVGTLVAAVAGCFALTLLVEVVRKARLHWFAAYCFVLGAVVIALNVR